jgi:hypothetical protein
MDLRRLVLATVVVALSIPAAAQETPKNLAATYDALADGILALHRAEAKLVRAVLTAHRDAAVAAAARGAWEEAAAHVALFANEGDNAVGGVRKRLVEGGHHHHAQAGETAAYEPGYVLVTRQAKLRGLAIAALLRQVGTTEARTEALGQFQALAQEVLGSD